MEQKTKMYSEKDIEKEFITVSDEEFRDAVINHEFPEFMYGLVFPEIE
ncbi:MAG: hypothetical protein Q4F12_04630 [Erysipelotrichaceae bacterium]|nr:hypothetical protein [Erysipelotrichaceae bacterium]